MRMSCCFYTNWTIPDEVCYLLRKTRPPYWVPRMDLAPLQWLWDYNAASTQEDSFTCGEFPSFSLVWLELCTNWVLLWPTLTIELHDRWADRLKCLLPAVLLQTMLAWENIGYADFHDWFCFGLKPLIPVLFSQWSLDNVSAVYNAFPGTCWIA